MNQEDKASNEISSRREKLMSAEQTAAKLFEEIERRGMIRAEISESHLNDEIYRLAKELLGVNKFWHKRIVRAGKNTLCPYREDPPDLIIRSDDILFLDLGPILEDWEADLGRTYVIGADPKKIKLKHDVEKAWELGRSFFVENPSIRASELFAYVVNLADEMGWQFGQEHCGHLIGNFPHENIRRREACNFIHPDNPTVMMEPGPDGLPRDWILEVHFIDKGHEMGSFFEQLLFR